MGKRLYKKATDSTPALVKATTRELEALEARLATKLLATSVNTPVPLHARVAGYSALLERPASTPTTPWPPAAAAAASAAPGAAETEAASAGAAAAGAATAVALVRRYHHRSKSAGGAEMGAKDKVVATGGRSSRCRPRIYSREDPLGTPPSSPRHARFSPHRKHHHRQGRPSAAAPAAVRGAGSAGAVSPMVSSSYLGSSVKVVCGDDTEEFEGGAGELGGSKRKCAAAFAAAETSSSEDKKDGNGCRGGGRGGGTTGFLTACSFTGYRSDSMLPPLLSSSLQGEGGPCLGGDGALQHPTLPDVGPSLSPEPEQNQDECPRRGGGDSSHPIRPDSVPGHPMALMPRREQNDERSSTFFWPGEDTVVAATASASVTAPAAVSCSSSSSAVEGPSTEVQQRRQAPAMTAALDDDVEFLGTALGASSTMVAAGATAAVVRSAKVADGGGVRDAGRGGTTSVLATAAALAQGVSLEVDAAAEAGRVRSSMVMPTDMDMDYDWLQVRNGTRANARQGPFSGRFSSVSNNLRTTMLGASCVSAG